VSVPLPNLAGMDESATESHFMTGREVCDLLHISKSTLAAWREDGTLAAHPLPKGRWRYPADQTVILNARAALRRPA
jgi:predicted site-specific integrase-resolvase